MTLDQCLKAARLLDERYMSPICSRVERCENGKFLQHLRWMVREMHAGMSENKAMRWLGYIQGILVGVYGQSLEDMKALSKEAVS